MSKEGYKPTSGMQSAARRAIKLKEDGKANGAGTAVGWTRARQLANGETLSLSTVKRMYSFFSRHEVDKKGKDWNNSENPSNGKIMWLAWGGDAGYSWSRKIVNSQKKTEKSMLLSDDIVEEIKDILDDIVNPITKVIEIEDDVEKTDSCDCTTCKEQNISCDQCDKCMSKSYESDNEELDKWDNIEKACWTGYKQEGMKEKDGRMVPNCVPVKKSDNLNEDPIEKSMWGGNFDPLDLVKRKFSEESRRRLADTGAAMPDGSYPISNKKDLENAIRSWGRGGSDPKVKAHIKRRAKALGLENLIPDNWK